VLIPTLTPGGPAGRTHSLWINSLDVIRQPGQQGGYGAAIDSIHVHEAGPGAVSHLSAQVDDPGAVLSFPEKAPVLWWDQVNDRPLFAGWLTSPTRTVFGGVGRTFAIEAIGVEAALDWLKLGAAVTFAAGGYCHEAVQATYAQCIPVPGVALRAFSGSAALGTSGGTQAKPIGLFSLAVDFARLGVAVTLAQGTSLREAIRQLYAVSDLNQTAPGVPNSPLFTSLAYATVDFYMGLRVWPSFGVAGAPSGPMLTPPADFTTLTVPAAGVFPADGEHAEDFTSTVHQVLVLGGNAAGTGVVTDGSGIPGEVPTINDSTLLTAAARDAAGQAYLADHSPTERGSFRLEAWPGSANVRPGSLLAYTDTQLGISGTRTVLALDRDINPSGTHELTVEYGGPRPSGAALLRSLTRDVLS
jgi:hypothetical protein